MTLNKWHFVVAIHELPLLAYKIISKIISLGTDTQTLK